MNRKFGLAASAALFAALAVTTAAPARADTGVRLGVVSCNVDSGWGFVFGSTRELKCTFTGANGVTERYSGHVNEFGIDVGYQAGGVIVWGVFAPTLDVGQGALAGEYGGVTGEAAAGIGAGANLLIGGFKNSVTLQPLSVEGTTGVNVAAGIAQVRLHYEAT
jgi:hypothetical protein